MKGEEALRFWFVAFVVLFVAVELFQWVAALGSWQPTGMWLLLGGMGLAAASNAGRLKDAASQIDGNLSDRAVSDSSAASVAVGASADGEKFRKTEVLAEDAAAIALSASTQTTKSTSVDKTSDKDSISFKVRPLKR